MKMGIWRLGFKSVLIEGGGKRWHPLLFELQAGWSLWLRIELDGAG